jgi:hypothetical protein
MTRTQSKINDLEYIVKETLSNESTQPFIKTIILEKYHYELFKLYQQDNNERHI